MGKICCPGSDNLVELITGVALERAAIPPKCRAALAMHASAAGETAHHLHGPAAGSAFTHLRAELAQNVLADSCPELTAPAQPMHDRHAPIDLPPATCSVTLRRRDGPRHSPEMCRAGD